MTPNVILTASDIYWVLMLPGVFHALAWLGALVIIASVALTFYYACLDCSGRGAFLEGKGGSDCDNCRKNKKWSKVLAICLFSLGSFLFVINFFVPTRNQLIAMYVIPPIVNNVGVQKMPDNLVILINKEMESLISGIEKKDAEKKKEDDGIFGKKKEVEKKEEKAALEDSMKQIAIDAATKAAIEAVNAVKK